MRMRFTAGLFVLTVLNAIVGETESAREAMRVVGQPPRLFVVEPWLARPTRKLVAACKEIRKLKIIWIVHWDL